MFFISESLCSGDSLKAVALPEEDFMDVAFDHFGLGIGATPATGVSSGSWGCGMMVREPGSFEVCSVWSMLGPSSSATAASA